MTQEERLQFLIQWLLRENPEYRNNSIPEEKEEQKRFLRGLMNICPPKAIDDEFLKVQDVYLQMELEEKGITAWSDLNPIQNGIYLWQGDITTLHCDAIVNAANGGLTGCYVPNHQCIDNAIHFYAGMQLRMECAEIMMKQGREEVAGRAKITNSYNLPCHYVLHTVGPIVYESLTSRHCEVLASCYQSCLELAAQNALKSVAFCCISTGEFRFPNRRAAEIAISTVTDFMKKESSVKKVIFNVFKDTDKKIYEELLA